MRLRATTLTAVLLAAGAAGAQTPGYRPGIDVLDYDFDLTLPERGGRVEIESVLTVLRTAPLDSLVLDLVGMRVGEASVQGAPAPFRQTAGGVSIALPPGAGDTLLVSVAYAGEPRDGLIIRENGGWTAFGDNWPNRGRQWLATVDHPSDKATVSWTVTAPAGRAVVANGVRLETRDLGNGRVRTRFRQEVPIPTYLMVVGAGPLRCHDLGETACGLAERAQCVPQAVWTLPGSTLPLPGPFALADRMVELFATLVAPYPYDKLGHVQSETRFGGMENASIIFYSDESFSAGTLDERLIAHETAHQWFGNSVTPADWPHLWLSEGFATYFAELWIEHAEGPEALRTSMEGIRSQLLAAPVVRQRPVIDTSASDPLALLNANSYAKGAWVLHMLRAELGDSTFFDGVRGYYAAHRAGNALTDDLRRAMEASSSRELGWFFEQWLERPGLPTVEVTPVWTGGELALEVQQTQAGGPYRFTLEIEVAAGGGPTHRLTVPVREHESQWVRVPGTRDPRSTTIVLDPEARLLAELRLTDRPTERTPGQ